MANLFLRVFLAAVLLTSLLYGSPSDATSPAAPSPPNSLSRQQESLEKQRESLQHQNAGAAANHVGHGAFIAPLLPLVVFDCQPLPRSEVDALISPAARKTGVASNLLLAVMKQESGFKPCAVSEKGALGLMQLMPATAEQFRVADPFDPEQNVEAGAALLKQLLSRYKGDLRLSLAAYNAGANRADQANSATNLNPATIDSYPLETQRYVAAILAELGGERVPASPAPQTGEPPEVPAASQPNAPPQ